MFKDRLEAGHLLADKLKNYKSCDGVVLAVPRGGIPVASVIAKELFLPIEVILTKKIGHPNNKEYAIGAVSLTDYFVVPHQNISEKYIEQEVEKIRERLHEMKKLFVGHKPITNIKNKIIILVDDGVATGNTLLGTVRVLKKNNPKKIIIAVPVASESAVKKLSAEVDEIVTNLIPNEFYGVGSFYENFEQLEDEEVLYYLYGHQQLSRTSGKGL
jgi:predicted phosphoribosyltransferase